MARREMKSKGGKPASGKAKGCIRGVIRTIEYGLFASAVLATLAFTGLVLLFYLYARDLPSLEPLDLYSSASGPDARWSQATQIQASDGTLIGQFYEEDRVILNIGQIPPVMQKAIIAVEDERFDRSHPFSWVRDAGIDPVGIVRAALANFLSGGRRTQGGSTITQQLAKNLFLTRDKTIRRKIQEIALAYRIEHKYSRDEIMERYLNKVFFGNRAYGVASAATRYFGVDLTRPGSTLTLGQAAMLAGLVKAPSSYAPHRHRDRAEARQRIVLGRMVDCGYIRPDEIEPAIKDFWDSFDSKVVTVPDDDTASFDVRVSQAGFFVEYVRQELLRVFDEETIYRGGIVVRTTLDPRMQAAAEAAVKRGLESLTRELPARTLAKGPLEAALVVIDHKTGAVLAMVGGGSGRGDTQFNRAVQARRQAGSSFKPFVYYTALSETATLGTVLRDEQILFEELQNWSPSNYDNKFHGPVLPRTAITHSYNVAAVQMYLQAGGERIIRALGEDFGINTASMKPYPSLALGAFEVTLLEMTSAYSAWANEGTRFEPYPILSVSNRLGRAVPARNGQGERSDFTPFPSHRVSRPEVSYLMTSILQSVVQRGTAASAVGAKIGRIPAAGKTGTTNDYADAWFVGYTPSITCGVWVGFDARRTMGSGMTGGRAAGRIWADFVRNAFKDQPPGAFPAPPPDKVVSVSVCALSGLRPSPDCVNTIQELFLAGTAPVEICPYHSDPALLQEFLYGAAAADTGLVQWPDITGIGLDLAQERRNLQEILDAEAPPPAAPPTTAPLPR